jgi:hypothetical protein
MREHVRSAVSRRDARLARIRRLTLWITGGAAATSLGLGAAFAHSLPGHASAGTGSPAPAAHSAPPAGPGSAAGQAGHQHHRRDALAAPRHAPAPAPAPPAQAPVTSGGS